MGVTVVFVLFWQLAVMLFVLARCGGTITCWTMAKMGIYLLSSSVFLISADGAVLIFPPFCSILRRVHHPEDLLLVFGSARSTRWVIFSSTWVILP